MNLGNLSLIAAIATAQGATAFSLLSPHRKARLFATPENPVVTFFWDGSVVELGQLEEVPEIEPFLENGDAASPQDLVLQALELAVAQWNQVEGAFIQLAVELNPERAQVDLPRVHSLGVAHSSDLSSAAFARPTIEGQEITNCHISIHDKATDLKDFVRVVTHEFGHCLGLGHSHDRFHSIMGYSNPSSSFRLGVDDRMGLIFLYPENSEDAAYQQTLQCGSLPAPPGRLPRPPLGLALTLLGVGIFLGARFNRQKLQLPDRRGAH